MLALRKTTALPGLQLQDLPDPLPPSPGEVLVRVLATGVCGTDLHIDDWTASYGFMAPHLPLTIGHEFSGEVTAVGEGVSGLQPGQRVVVRPSVVCGACAACGAGRPDDCERRQGIGVARDGAFASSVRVPARNAIAIPHELDPVIAALAEPLSVSWESVRRGGVRPGDRVLVLGPGNIGQGIALFARERGARVVVAGHDDSPRLGVLRSMGFDALVDFAVQPDGLAPFLAQAKFEVVIEASGSAAAVRTGLAALRQHGVLVVTGIASGPVPVDLASLVRNHQDVRGSYRAPESAWPEVLAFMQSHADVLRRMVTHTVPLARALEGFELARRKQAAKVMVLP